MVKEKHLVDVVPAGIISFTDEGIIQFVNDHLCTLLGYNKKELEQTHLENILTISGKVFYHTHLFPLLRLQNKADEIFFFLKAKDGTHVPVLTNASRDNELNHCVFIAVHQRKKYEEEILQSKRAAESALEKNEVLTRLKEELQQQLAESEHQLRHIKQVNQEYVTLNKIVSHDLHEPIRKLLIYINILLEQPNVDPQELAISLNRMQQQAMRLRTLAMNLQQFVSIDNTSEAIVDIDLEQLIKEVFDEVAKRQSHLEANLTIHLHAAVQGYPSQIRTFFTEIILNAFNFKKTDQPLELKVSGTVYKENIYKEISNRYLYVDVLRIEIEDNGIGFSSKYKEYVFEMFSKINLQTKGAGFGLALCKKIVERHYGSIKANSDSNGTSITVVLPLKTIKKAAY